MPLADRDECISYVLADLAAIQSQSHRPEEERGFLSAQFRTAHVRRVTCKGWFYDPCGYGCRATAEPKAATYANPHSLYSVDLKAA